MSVRRRRFSKEFKLEAVGLVLEGDRSLASIARDLEITSGLLGKWKQQYLEDPETAFPGEGRLKAENEELRRLHRELSLVTQERDILKKAVAIFTPRRR